MVMVMISVRVSVRVSFGVLLCLGFPDMTVL